MGAGGGSSLSQMNKIFMVAPNMRTMGYMLEELFINLLRIYLLLMLSHQLVRPITLV